MTDILVTLSDLPTLSDQVYGEGQDWIVDADAGGIQGMFDASARVYDLERRHGDGDIDGPHYETAQTIRIPVSIGTDKTASEAVQMMETLREAWRAVDGDPVTLTVILWDNTFTYLVKPLGARVSTMKGGRDLLLAGYATALCSCKVYELTGS